MNIFENLWVYDFEVTEYDWLVVIKNHLTKERVHIWNSSVDLRTFFAENEVDGLVSYNGQGYDKFILAGCYNGLSNEKIKEINDHIIGGNNPYELKLFSPTNKIPQIDLMLDVRKGTSLKAIEAHLGYNIVESSIPFDIDRPLTESEVQEMFEYCDYDVDRTDDLITIRWDYLETKIALGARCNIDAFQSMCMTNAKLTARLLGAVKTTYDKNEFYEPPKNVDFSIVPTEIMEYFKSLDGVNKTTFKYEIPGCTLTYSDGGVHGSAEGENFEFPAIKPILCGNDDVASLYPSLLDIYKYISRSCSNPNAYHDLKVERITAKHNGDKKTASYLKSPLNACSGAQDAPFNDLYDPRTRFMRYTGQLLISIYIFKLIERVPDIQFINVNTDGVAFYYDEQYKQIVDEIMDWWQKTTMLELERDSISRIWLKDVNNLLIEKTNGKLKVVGGELNHGITNKGAFAINNNLVIVKEAVVDYLAKGIPIEETISNCKDLLKFQMIAKVSHKYTGAMQIIDNKEVEVQRCNRVYATANDRYGTIYKKNRKTGNWEKVASLPDHCLIDNDNHLSVEDIDLNFYIDKAQSVANKFLSKGDIGMADKKNIYQKLADLREDFYKSGMKKSGVNSHASFKYFQLEDIVPIASEVFKKHKVVFLVSMDNDLATGKLVDLESDDVITITLPMSFIAEPAKFRQNEVQAHGSSFTYYRRYLYFVLFDIVENDDIEQQTPKVEVEKPVVKAPSKPLTPTERKEVKEEVVASNDNADELLLNALKSACGSLLKIDKEKYKKVVGDIQIKTNKFTTGTKKEVEALIKRVNTEVKKNEVV